MRIIFTCVAWEDTSKKLNSILKEFNDFFGIQFLDKFYGSNITECQVTVIAVDSDIDRSQNSKIAKKSNVVGSFKHLINGKKIRYIGFGLEYLHEDIVSKDIKILTALICSSLCRKLDNADIKIPKDFDYQKFSYDLKMELKRYMR